MSYASVTTPLELIFSDWHFVELGANGFRGSAIDQSDSELRPAEQRRRLDSSFLHELRLVECMEELQGMKQLTANWDSYGANRPSDRAIHNAILTLGELNSISVLPAAIRPTADESIVFEVRADDNCHLMEFFSNGDIVWLERRGDQEHAHDLTLDHLRHVLPQIKHG